jgi:hypothetical protein
MLRYATPTLFIISDTPLSHPRNSVLFFLPHPSSLDFFRHRGILYFWVFHVGLWGKRDRRARDLSTNVKTFFKMLLIFGFLLYFSLSADRNEGALLS